MQDKKYLETLERAAALKALTPAYTMQNFCHAMA
jgi:hypothetical protein